MATTEIDRDAAANPSNKPQQSANKPSTSRGVDQRLEVIVIPVSDVDRAKAFYARLGWRLDADFASGDDWRVIQFTPPGSACSVIFGRNVTAAAPGSVRGLYLIVSDLEAARKDLLDRGIEVSAPFHGAGDVHAGTDEPYLSGSVRVSGADPSAAATAHLPRSAIPTAMAGCSRRSRRDCRDGSRATARHSLRRLRWPQHCAARRRHMASTKSGPAGTMRTGPIGTPIISSASRRASRCRPELDSTHFRLMQADAARDE